MYRYIYINMDMYIHTYINILICIYILFPPKRPKFGGGVILIMVQPIPFRVTFSNSVSELKAQSSNVSFATFQWQQTFELWALSFELWALKELSKMSFQMGLAVQINPGPSRGNRFWNVNFEGNDAFFVAAWADDQTRCFRIELWPVWQWRQGWVLQPMHTSVDIDCSAVAWKSPSFVCIARSGAFKRAVLDNC